MGENRDELEHVGLPLAIYQDADHWEDFLQNGHLHWHADGPPFEFDDLSPEKTEQLWEFLERHYANEPPELLRWLRVRLDKPNAE